VAKQPSVAVPASLSTTVRGDTNPALTRGLLAAGQTSSPRGQLEARGWTKMKNKTVGATSWRASLRFSRPRQRMFV
jgi:hypothetical protein